MTGLAFTDGFNQGISLPSMNRQCTNLYPKHIEDGDIIRKRLFGTPGLTQLATTGGATEANRGSHVMARVPYFVNGITLYKLNDTGSSFTITTIGTVGGSGKVSMSDNGIQLMVLVPGGSGFIYNKDTMVFGKITDPDFTANGAPQVVFFIDSYFMVTTDSKKFIVSAVNDGTSWNALDFGTAESDPDAIVGGVNFKNEAYIAGAETFEAFDNIGGTDFPYQRNGLFLDKGLFARFSIVSTSDTFMFIGGSANESPGIWALGGNTLNKVSNTGIDLLLSALEPSQLDEVTGYTYTQDNSTFIAWDLPNETVVYGLDTGKWHKRQSQIADIAGNIDTTSWRATALITAYGKLICFDKRDGRVGEVSIDYYDEYGTEIQRTFDASPLRNGNSPFSVPRLEVSMEAGVGDLTTINPKIRMKASRDAKTFTGERSRDIGAQGEFNKRAVFRRNGLFRQYGLFRFLFSDPVKAVVIDVDAEIIGGRV